MLLLLLLLAARGKRESVNGAVQAARFLGSGS
jgi:hypothetical protein